MIIIKGEENDFIIEEMDENMKASDVRDEDMVWYDPKQRPFKISGFPWFEKEQTYRRLPRDPMYTIPNSVHQLADYTTGGQIRFQTNSTKLAIRVELKDKANMNHMSALGQCGFDCYIGEPTKQKFCSSTVYDHTQKIYEASFFERESDDFVQITLNFPLYQGVNSVVLGVDASAKVIEPSDYDTDKKVIFYGTSITQGGCASRAGMAYTNIISRRFNQEFINLGFSGSGKGEANMAKLIREIEKPACLILDYEPNCVSTSLYMKTLPNFIHTYRQYHQEVPILLVSKFPFSTEIINAKLSEDRLARLDFQKKLVYQLKRFGDRNLHFLDGTSLLGDNFDECTVDGIHPNDLGFMKIADNISLALKSILVKMSN